MRELRLVLGSLEAGGRGSRVDVRLGSAVDGFSR
jgi:hypothetical protein